MKKFLDSATGIGLTIIVGVVLVSGAIIGLIEATATYKKGGCKYESISGYVPTRVLTCEFIRKRW